ncbi:unnamed protein product [Mycena citricolor]|uniref:Uncharacterized protein n=1 Tax=Mycena citricolor TaxID=2018698 RepID=A0AAD2K8F2_9AGAR|nr:unnamed protein product [Mycena citricolor]
MRCLPRQRRGYSSLSVETPRFGVEHNEEEEQALVFGPHEGAEADHRELGS